MSAAWPPDRTFWSDEFPARTNGRTTPFLFKNIIPADAAAADAVLDGFAAIRRAHQTATPNAAHARVYVDEDRRDDRLDAVLSAPGWPDGDFVAWMQALAGADRFSLVINNLETVSPSLAAGLGAFLNALSYGWGAPAGGAELVAFAGNYSGTAFGVHEGYEDAFLTHYGPGVKHFYTWSHDAYQKLTGGSGPLYGDYLWLLEHGEHFALEPGDALFLPRRVFHVGRQDEFSVSVAVPLYTYPDAALLRQAILPDLFASLLTGDPDTPHGQPSPMQPMATGPQPATERLTALATATLTAAGEQAATAAAGHLRQRWNTLQSNGGWEISDDDLARSEASAAFDPAGVAAGAAVSVTTPYQLIVDGHQAFLRGLEIPADPAVLTPDLVSALNRGPTTMPADAAVITAVRAIGATGGLSITAPITGAPRTSEETHA